MKKTEKQSKDERPVYILCPHCEINYIDKREKLCAVCKAEMGFGDKSFLLPEEDEEQDERICPVCHVNPIGEDEEMCIECRKERDEKEKESREISELDDDDSVWEPYAEDEEEEIPEGMQEILIDDEEEEEEEEETETVSDEPDDFDFDVDPNDYDDEDEEIEDDEDD